MKRLHLICNAHLDPVWLWEWEEGAAEAVSTFRIAADFCERYDGFVFNHNEAILYQWVEEWEPALFERIQRLVAQGKWHIMGGWYLQPDCNMPSGESFVRQILAGHAYFERKFGRAPTTAINFDPFGHNRGLVQILKKSGFDSYIVCRPDQASCDLPDGPFLWKGFADTEIVVLRGMDGYNTQRGHVTEKIDRYLAAHPDLETGLVLWGIGNHGGGPSREDLEALARWAESHPEIELIHSVPERYFAEQPVRRADLPRVAKALNPWGVGCYTSQVRIKQKHRALENELYVTEKMASAAALQGFMEYDRAALSMAQRDLLTSEFHDILPGSSIAAVEESSLRLMDHGLEILSRVKARAFVSLLSGQAPAEESEIPVFLYNPHPYPIEGVFECEFQLADQNWSDSFSLVEMSQDGKEIPCQTEQEASNINLDWRKRAVFHAVVAPGAMTRFSSRFVTVASRPRPIERPENGLYVFRTADMEVAVNVETGLVDRYRVQGRDILAPAAFVPLVIADDDDPWGMCVTGFRTVVGRFALMPPDRGSAFSGLEGRVIDSVRVIEDGPVRAVVEAVMEYNHSFLCMRYKIPKSGTEIEVECRVFWNEKRRFLKLSIPTLLENPACLGQVAYGVERFAADGAEMVAQKWAGLTSPADGLAVTCINEGSYGFDAADGELRLSLLRSPGYSAHPIKDRPVMPQDRFSPHIDQGERVFRYWINASQAEDRLSKVDREALAHNEKPYVLSYYPSGTGKLPVTALTIDGGTVQLSALKMAEDGRGFVARLYEAAGRDCEAVLSVPALRIAQTVPFHGLEVKTFRLDAAGLAEVNLLESNWERDPL